MIINVRGTHGSGKSTLARNIMSHYEDRHEIFGGRSPIAYVCTSDSLQSLYVAGNYSDGVGGGCDHLKTMKDIFEPMGKVVQRGLNVLFEGILAQHSMPRMQELRDLTEDIYVVVLSTSVEQCAESVRERRLRKGNTKPLNTSNLEKEFRSVQSAARRLRGEGFSVHDLSRDEALAFALGMLEKEPSCAE